MSAAWSQRPAACSARSSGQGDFGTGGCPADGARRDGPREPAPDADGLGGVDHHHHASAEPAARKDPAHERADAQHVQRHDRIHPGAPAAVLDADGHPFGDRCRDGRGGRSRRTTHAGSQRTDRVVTAPQQRGLVSGTAAGRTPADLPRRLRGRFGGDRHRHRRGDPTVGPHPDLLALVPAGVGDACAPGMAVAGDLPARPWPRRTATERADGRGDGRRRSSGPHHQQRR
jgi:hypothetical protein